MPQANTINVDIEAIVREVIDRLRENSPGNPPSLSNGVLSSNGHPAVPAAPPPAVPAGSVIVDARVVTAQLLGRHFAGQAVLELRPDAVVTPSARDWLKERGVAVSTFAKESNPQAKTSVVLGVDGRFDLVPWLRREPLVSCDTQVLSGTGLATTVEEVTARVARGGLVGIVISDQPHAAVCLANRCDSVRAVHAPSPAAAGDAVAEVSANVLVVKASPELASLFDQFITPLIHVDGDGPAPVSHLR